jgi:hypothetical protein
MARVGAGTEAKGPLRRLWERLLELLAGVVDAAAELFAPSRPVLGAPSRPFPTPSFGELRGVEPPAPAVCHTVPASPAPAPDLSAFAVAAAQPRPGSIPTPSPAVRRTGAQEPAGADGSPGRGGRVRRALGHFLQFFMASGVGAFIEQAIQFVVFQAMGASYAVAGIGAAATFVVRMLSKALSKPFEKGTERGPGAAVQRTVSGPTEVDDRQDRAIAALQAQVAQLREQIARPSLTRAEPASPDPGHGLGG